MMMSQDSGATLNGRKGNDALVGLEGRDKLFGGAGADMFVLDLDGDRDVIRDFESGADVLNLTA